jgi:hypothetical protein
MNTVETRQSITGLSVYIATDLQSAEIQHTAKLCCCVNLFHKATSLSLSVSFLCFTHSFVITSYIPLSSFLFSFITEDIFENQAFYPQGRTPASENYSTEKYDKTMTKGKYKNIHTLGVIGTLNSSVRLPKTELPFSL